MKELRGEVNGLGVYKESMLQQRSWLRSSCRSFIALTSVGKGLSVI